MARFSQFGCVGGELACVHRLAPQSELAGDGGDRHRVVAGDHLDRNILGGEIIQCRAGVGAHFLLEHHQRDGYNLAGRVRVVHGHLTTTQ